jgi:zinc transporter ZupT
VLVESFALGAVAQLSLPLSGLVVFRIEVRTPVIGALAAFAAGGILAMLTDSLIPFADERSERAGLWTVIGFCAALAMT